MSTKLIYWLLCNYALIALVSARERNWPRVLYWLAAMAITASTVWMQRTGAK